MGDFRLGIHGAAGFLRKAMVTDGLWLWQVITVLKIRVAAELLDLEFCVVVGRVHVDFISFVTACCVVFTVPLVRLFVGSGVNPQPKTYSLILGSG